MCSAEKGLFMKDEVKTAYSEGFFDGQLEKIKMLEAKKARLTGEQAATDKLLKEAMSKMMYPPVVFESRPMAAGKMTEMNLETLREAKKEFKSRPKEPDFKGLDVEFIIDDAGDLPKCIIDKTWAEKIVNGEAGGVPEFHWTDISKKEKGGLMESLESRAFNLCAKLESLVSSKETIWNSYERRASVARWEGLQKTFHEINRLVDDLEAKIRKDDDKAIKARRLEQKLLENPDYDEDED